MKRHLMAPAAACLALALTACSGGGSSAGSQSEKSLVWSMWIAGQEDQAEWQKVADEVAAENDGLKITIQGAPFNDYWTKLRTQLSAGSAPCIVSIQSLRTANYKDVLLPIDDKVHADDLKDFDSTALEGMKVDGKLYGLPYDTGPMLLFYNKDLFEEAGIEAPEPGWSVEDFEKAGAALKAKGKQLFAPSAEDIPLEATVLAYNGGRVVKEDGSLDVENPDFGKGLDWLHSLVAKGYSPEASSDPSPDDNAFINGTAATYLDGPWSIISQKQKVKFPLGLTTLPAGAKPATFSAGSGFGVSKQCQYPDQAVAAITTMTSEKVLTGLAKAGRAFPARTASQSAWYQNAGVDDAKKVFETAQRGAVPLPGNPNSDQLNQLFAQYAIQAINGQSSGADVLKQIAGQLPR